MQVNTLRKWGCALASLLLICSMQGWAADAPAQRVISVDGSITEIIYALQQQHRLVGRDTTSTWPEAAQDLPDVGYMRQLSAEGILSLRPDLILVTADAQPQSVLDQLQQARVDIRVIPNAYTLAGVEDKIIQVADALGVREAGVLLASEVVERTTDLLAELQVQSDSPVKAIFVMNAHNSSMMVAGKGSRADAFMSLAGVINPFSDVINNFQNVSGEALMQANPDIIITLDEVAIPGSGIERLLSDPAVRRTEAGRSGKVVAIEARWLNFGPDLPNSLDSLVSRVKAMRSRDESQGDS